VQHQTGETELNKH